VGGSPHIIAVGERYEGGGEGENGREGGQGSGGKREESVGERRVVSLEDLAGRFCFPGVSGRPLFHAWRVVAHEERS